MALVIDANAHVRATEAASHPRGGVPPDGLAPAEDPTAEDLLALMRQAAIDRALLVPHPPSTYDNHFCIEAAQRYPTSFVAVAKIDAAAPNARATTRELLAQAGVGGLRLEHRDGGEGSTWLDTTHSRALWEEAAASQVSISLPSVRRLDQLAALEPVVKRFPTVPIVLLHGLAEFPIEGGPPYPAAGPFFALAQFPNVYLAFAHHEVARANTENSSVEALFDLLLSRFGANRLLWASFFPARATAQGGLKGQIDRTRRELSFLAPADLDWIFGETASTLFPRVS